jgi:hypothetical protein
MITDEAIRADIVIKAHGRYHKPSERQITDSQRLIRFAKQYQSAVPIISNKEGEEARYDLNSARQILEKIISDNFQLRQEMENDR